MRWPKAKELTATSLLVLVTAGGFSGCAENETLIFLAGVLARDVCLVEGDLGAETMGGGVMDLSLTNTYNAALLVGNQLITRGDPDLLRAESSRIVLRGAIIELTDNAGVPLREPFSSPGTGFVHPGTGTSPGSGSLFAEVIPPGYVDEDQLVIANIRAYGQTLGGALVVSNTLSFPIGVCTGCLIRYPADADDPAKAGYVCNQGEPEKFEGCWLGQDDAVDCRHCSAFLDRCLRP